MWNPSLRKTLSHPSAVHKKEQLAAKKKKSAAEAATKNATATAKTSAKAAKETTSSTTTTSDNMATPCSTGTSKSVRLPSKTKGRTVSGLIHDSTNEAAGSRKTSTSSLAGSLGTTGNNNNNNMQLNVEEKAIPTTSPSKHKRSFIDGFKTSFKFKRNDFLGTGGGGGGGSSSSSSASAMASHSFDASTVVGKKTSLTSEHLNKMNPSIRRWSESAPRNAAAATTANNNNTGNSSKASTATTGNNSANKDL